MRTEKFRRELRQEAEQWWQEGLIDASLYEQLARRYRFESLEREASHQFIAILMGLGGLLLGLAAITFVAANWQVWPRLVKLILLLTLFLGVNAAGFYLWRRPGHSRTGRLGQGLLLLGALLLGANLGLMSQMFHQSGNAYELFLVWGLGVVAMAFSLRLVSLSVLAWILLAIGYTMAWMSQWGVGGSIAQPWQLVVQHMPIVASVLFIPLAYRCRSRVLFSLGAAGATISLALNLSQILVNGWVVALACVLPPALLWSYSRRIWRSGQIPDPFQPTARSLALGWLGLLFSGFAFRFWWQNAWTSMTPVVSWQPLIDAGLLLVITGLGWLQLRHRDKAEYRAGYVVKSPQWRPERALHSGTIALFSLVTALLLVWQYEAGPIGAIGTVAFNLMLFGLAVGLIRDGLALGGRDAFWGGMALLVAGIISRMLEYDTGLLLKSIVFALCGLGVIAAGLWFERRVSPRRLSPSPTQEKPL